MWQVSGFLIWLPLYVFMAYYLLKHTRWIGIIMLIFTLFLSDQISWQSKESIKRLRPSHSLDVQTVNGYKGGKYGFFSGHAANSFAVSAYFVVLFSRRWNWLWLWAALVSYSRVYLGVHFPSDVLVGGLVGSVIGFMVARFLFPKFIKFHKKLLHNVFI
jgi:undecaprenyl-diphosphatase